MFLFPVIALPQETRETEINKKKAEKSQHLTHHVPGKAERITRRVEQALSLRPTGFYPFVGSIYTGGLLAAGPGYRFPFDDTGVVDFHAAWSIENYRMLDTSLTLPAIVAGTITPMIYGRYTHAGRVPFHGVGNDSREDEITHYLYNPTYVGLNATYHPGRLFSVGGGVEYQNIHSGVTENFEDAPGADLDPTYTVPIFSTAFNWKQTPSYTTSGGLYRLELRDYIRRNSSEKTDFRWLETEVNQFIPILRANQVIALQALATITYVDGENIVPHFMMPRLGGSHYLRGFGTARFVDRHRLLLAAEYRWAPSKFMDVALYYEAGKVASDTSDLDLKDLHRDFGIGFRFHSPAMTMLRIELAHSNEATRFIFTVGPAF